MGKFPFFNLPVCNQQNIVLSFDMVHKLSARCGMETFAVACEKGITGIKRAVADWDNICIVVIFYNILLCSRNCPSLRIFQFKMIPCLFNRHLSKFIKNLPHF